MLSALVVVDCCSTSVGIALAQWTLSLIGHGVCHRVDIIALLIEQLLVRQLHVSCLGVERWPQTLIQPLPDQFADILVAIELEHDL